MPGTHADSVLTVDAWVVGDPSRQVAGLACRSSGMIPGYMLLVSPIDGSFMLGRADGGSGVQLVGPKPDPRIRRGNATNRLMLACVGSTISAFINGTLVGSASDGRYSSGTSSLVVEGAEASRAEGRFDNLTLSRP